MRKVLTILSILFIVSGCFGIGEDTLPYNELTQKKEYSEVTVSCVGDVMVHMLQLQAHYNEALDKYDFRNSFQYIKPYIKKSNLAIANLETTFGGTDLPYSGYPKFNTPDQLADALKFAGFEVISTANNHTLDTGLNGMKRTLDILLDNGLRPVGTKKTKEGQTYLIKEINQIKIGIAAYTFESPSSDGVKRLNGIPIPKEAEKLIDTFDYHNLEQGLENMKEKVETMKSQGAEVLIFLIHWGTEYQRNYNSQQEKIARALSSYGVDVIFGSHPHVIQPIKQLVDEPTGKKTLVVYSLGNFLSNQRFEFVNNRYTEDGLIVQVKFKKNLETKEVIMENAGYIPTWVNRHVVNERWVYEILPVHQALRNKEKYNLVTEDSINRAKMSLSNTVNWIEEHNDEIIQIKEDR